MGKIDLEKILIELAEDNEDSFEVLFNYYYPRLYNFSKSFLKMEDGIDDILQEVFVKIWQKRKSITTTVTFNSYIFTIARNLLLNELRRRLNSENIKETVQSLSTAEEYSSSQQIEFQELKEKVDYVIDKHPERRKEIFILSRTEGLSHKEIAEKLGIKTKTVEYHISLVIKDLKEEFKGFGVMSLLYLYLFL
ncbi:MAG: RNA polymerase sigma-70 factor [Marinilabiliaceae bacterium]|nr:RNA polymerase sigma-70 factor [Marinilabiliaceae bacterium]